MNEEQLRKMIEVGVSPVTIIHGHLKTLMYECGIDLDNAQEPTVRDYLQGRLDAFIVLYKLTHDISFAQGDTNE